MAFKHQAKEKSAMNLDHLKYFIVTAKHEHIIKASEELHITQSTLSRAIHNLEEETGLKLFDRIGRNICITPQGRIFAEKTGIAVDMIDQAIDEARLSSHMIKGEVRLGCYEAVLKNDIPEIVAETARLYPDIVVSSFSGPSRYLAAQVQRDEMDLAVCVGNIDMEQEFNKLQFRVLKKEEIVLVVPRGHAFSKRGSASIAEINRERILFRNSQAGITYCLKRIFLDEGIVFNTNSILSGDTSYINSVKKGEGVTFLGIETALQYKDEVDLVHLDCRKASPYRNIYLISKNDGYLSLAAVQLAKIIEGYFSDLNEAEEIKDAEEMTDEEESV